MKRIFNVNSGYRTSHQRNVKEEKKLIFKSKENETKNRNERTKEYIVC